uniref:Uncharacterized protein n=1 Tax=Rhizophora mucronata TaxID=61149 RepID=A0A2P2R306_RHIMU
MSSNFVFYLSYVNFAKSTIFTAV